MGSSPSSAPKKRRLWLRLCVTLTISFLALEGLARWYSQEASNGMDSVRFKRLAQCALLPYQPTDEVLESWLGKIDEARFKKVHPELGWSHSRSATSKVRDPHGRPLLYTTNSQGFRAEPDRVYPPTCPPGGTRLVVLGDSFTFGADVSLEDAWTTKLEEQREGIEVINLGVPAYGMDQAFLRWRVDGTELDATHVLLVIWPEDILRNLNLFRYYLMPRSGFLLAKPRFVLEGGELQLVNSPIPAADEVAAILRSPLGQDILEHEYWFDPSELESSPLDASRLVRVLRSVGKAQKRLVKRQRLYSGEDPTAIDLAVAIAGRFQREVEATGARPVVVILPQQDLLERFPGDEDFPLVGRLRELGLDVINLFPLFTSEEDPFSLFYPSAHFNPKGCTKVADALYAELEALN